MRVTACVYIMVMHLGAESQAFNTWTSSASYFANRVRVQLSFKNRMPRFCSKAGGYLEGPTDIAASVPRRYSRADGLSVLDTTLFPPELYGERMAYGRDAQGLEPSKPVTPDDPRMSLAYGEFPLESADALIDLALSYITANDRERPFQVLDLGSGCGRLAAYLALTRGTAELPWIVHGIEISAVLHDVASRMTAKGEHFVNFNESNDLNHLALHHGPAEENESVLAGVHLIFAYSTAWESDGFSEELGAMIMSREWSELLANECQKGCCVITTERVLNPSHGWELVDRLDVQNREVLGSTGYIHVLR